ncbi:head GIN domain-containing protein [Protaetiibacter mangrovi]|uniref:DUF2807 domain-containing protein n=1 Tax=Protaetiibacter mangrovi TaxID=2970926 RepID=A0ABT1ZD40_9MICO|nr:head GIN domain-containing protein [Protaetiibacter mangrovi]MCS0498617.1 DUF2807 domain-containing protein [Protaetiibacter mangrovi]TPX03099.1 DUF2807 domain-containing protein [Schumannella luteola]
MTTTPRRTLAAAAALAVAAVALAGCVHLPSAAGAPRVDETYAVSDDVHALRLETAGDVVVQLGDEPGLTVRAPRSVVDRLTVDEEDGTLVLGMTGPGIWAGRIDYTLTVRTLDDVEVEGSGDVRADLSAAHDVAIDITGSGDVRATGVDADSVDVAVEGSGDVRIEGTADAGRLSVSGSGDIDAARLVLRTASAETSGSGDVAVHATGTLDARISGSGDIRVTGSPRVTRDVSGSGDLVGA